MNVVRRMCALRRIASTAPSTESQTNSVAASSSAQISGRSRPPAERSHPQVRSTTPSGQRAAIALQYLPGVFAELAAPFGVEAGGLERVLERLLVHRIEGEALLFQLRLERGVKRRHRSE